MGHAGDVQAVHTVPDTCDRPTLHASTHGLREKGEILQVLNFLLAPDVLIRR